MNINQQIAIKGAEFLTSKMTPAARDLFGLIGFDPVNDANDMNKLIEALKLSIIWKGTDWFAECMYGSGRGRSKSRDEAIRECVIKALGIGVDND